MKPAPLPISLVCFAALAFSMVLSNPSRALAQVTVQTVADFAGTDLSQAWGGVVKGPDDAYYGTAYITDFGCGAVYRLAANGTFTVLHRFTRTVDGCHPVGELVLGLDGNLYGTTSEGGPTTVPLTAGRGNGTIFRISASGQFTHLHEFAFDQARGIAPEGAMPLGSLALAGDGHFYGLTNNGGDPGGCGTVFRITAAGAFTVLHSLWSTPNGGCFANSGLKLGTDGNLYGTTAFGGGQSSGGTVFRVTTAGVYSQLAAFPTSTTCNCGPFGLTPLAEPVQDATGDLYGTTQTGGPSPDPSQRFGTVWKLSPAGAFTLLHAFDGTDGHATSTGLTMGSDGNLYGASYGVSGFSTLFRITPAGIFTKLHTFTQSVGADGRLLEIAPGVFLGTTQGGGAQGRGLIYRLSIASPTVTTLVGSPASTVYGQHVTFTATVSSASGSPTGQVEFYDGTALIGLGVINNGDATLSTSALLVGAHAVSAAYLGDGSFMASNSGSVSVTVSRAQTAMTLATVPDPSQRRQFVTLNVTVAAVAPGSGTPTGEIHVIEGKKRIGSATLQGATASLQISFKSMGQQQLRVVYSGDANFLGTEALRTHAVGR